MSQAEELLNTLAAGPDTGVEGHIVIDSSRNITVPKELRRIAVQFDHNVETVTFDCPRYWDGLDMSKMTIYVNYMRADRGRGKFEAKNITVDETDSTIMHFDWTLTKLATLVKGPLKFLVCIVKTDTYGNEENHWNSELCDQMHVSEGLETGPAVLEMHADVITDLLVRMDKILIANSPILDTGLTQRGLAADAKATGDAITRVQGELLSDLNDVSNSIKSETAALSKAISIETVNRKAEINVERKRIDKFVALQQGSTTGDAELQDIRIGLDGTLYGSAGDAVRGQYNQLATSINQLVSGVEDGFIDLEGTVNKEYDVWKMINHLIPIAAVTSVCIYLWADVLCVAYYDKYGQFIGGVEGSGQPQNTGEALTTFENAPERAVYFKYCWRLNYNVEPTIVYSNFLEELIKSDAENKLQMDDCLNRLDDLSVTDYAKETVLTNRWSSGYYNQGVAANSAYGWKTNDFYDCTDVDFEEDSNAKIKFTIGEEYVDAYKVTIVVYDANENFIADIARKEASDLSNLDFTSYGNRLKFKAYLLRTDDQTISEIGDDIVNDILVVAKTYTAKANVNGLAELKAELFDYEKNKNINKIAFIGDSFTWLDVYTKKVQEFVGASGYTNYGFNGLSIVNVYSSKMTELENMVDCDAMIFWMGTNDFGQEKDLGEYDSADTTTITGAFRALCDFFSLEKFAHMSKLIITPCQRWGYTYDPIKNSTMTNSKDITLETISERIKSIAHEYGFRVLDFYHESGINKTTAAWLTRDGLHPTDAYFNKLAITIASELKTLP